MHHLKHYDVLHNHTNNYFERVDEHLKNRELIVIVPEILPPFVNYLNISYEYEKDVGYGPGIVWQILRSLSEHLNLTYRVETVELNSDMRWEEAFKLLKNTEAEIIVGATVMQHHASKNVTFTTPFQYEETGLIYKMSTEHLFNRQQISFGPFSAQVWLIALFCLLLSSLILRASAIYLQKKTKDRSMFDHCLMFFSAMTRHSVNFKSQLTSGRFLIMTWYFGSLILFIIYMVGSTFMPNYASEAVPFKTLKSVVDTFETSNKYKLVLNRNSGRTQMLRKSVLNTMHRLWTYANENDAIIYAENIDDGIRLVRENSNYFFMGPLDTFRLVVNKDCRLHVVPEGFLSAFMGIALKEGSYYARPLNRVILDLVEFGYIEKWIRGYGIYMSSSFNGSCDAMEEGHFFDLKMSILRGPFILFGVGLCCGVVFFGAEWFRDAYFNSKLGQRFYRWLSRNVKI